ncbi:SDR family oxidoreductase [Maribellus sp. YY47]|uniref:SDR family oxidoreductase n=1 Tax=Maribellus sp. YY47 TaxID=2929486 RepID=UPI0020019104|nr:SDR family oxidoreductase [Maribellus sp. YY47]MCK3684304.1 SDR family oxidoreductase [Maribellus sp. YY47]
MKILLTGVTGYVGKRILPVLIDKGHEVICCVREKRRLTLHKPLLEKIRMIEIDFLDEVVPGILPDDIDAAYYLIHSMSSSKGKFDELESRAAENFKKHVESTSAKQVIYLSGISNQDSLSKHLRSRRMVEDILRSDRYSLTVLRAGIIVGSGSASFEIIRDIVEKLPILITPKWILTKSQPIAIRDVIQFLVGVLGRTECYGNNYDIGGPEILTYKDMMLQYAEMRKLKRRVYTTSLISPRISSYWLFFITSVSFSLSVSLVDSMKNDVTCKDNQLAELLKIQPITYKTALKYAFLRIKQNLVLSSWKDSIISSSLGLTLSDFIEVPNFGCYKDIKKLKVENVDQVIHNIWRIGGEKGYYYANWLWQTRGWFDLLLGGVGLIRGRKLPEEITTGEALDFWRVLYASREKKRLLLFAEMKLPGEAWLEFRIDENNVLHQTATFRPRGILGRLYWIATSPFHFFIFNGMIRNIAKTEEEDR